MSHSVEPRTIRLQNVDPGFTQLSLSLALVKQKTQPRLRRGVELLAIVIGPGRYYDVCAQLACTFDEAQSVVGASPEVKAHANSGRLQVREFPTPPDVAAREAAEAERGRLAQVQSSVLNPPDPVEAVGAGVDLELAGLPADTPRRAGPPPQLDEREKQALREGEAAAIDQDLPSAGEDAGLGLGDGAAEGDEGEGDAEGDVEDVGEGVDANTPSSAWPFEQLLKFAEDKGIDTSKLKSKRAKGKLLRAIQEQTK